jgi:hypothetical protein
MISAIETDEEPAMEFASSSEFLLSSFDASTSSQYVPRSILTDVEDSDPQEQSQLSDFVFSSISSDAFRAVAKNFGESMWNLQSHVADVLSSFSFAPQSKNAYSTSIPFLLSFSQLQIAYASASDNEFGTALTPYVGSKFPVANILTYSHGLNSISAGESRYLSQGLWDEKLDTCTNPAEKKLTYFCYRTQIEADKFAWVEMNKTKKKEITENASRDLIASVGKWMISPVMGLLLNLEGGYSCSVNYFGCKPLHATTVSECPCKGDKVNFQIYMSKANDKILQNIMETCLEYRGDQALEFKGPADCSNV